MDLSGKTAIVTGGTKGIGRAIAEALISQGANVSICARREDEVQSAISQLNEIGKVMHPASHATSETMKASRCCLITR